LELEIYSPDHIAASIGVELSFNKKRMDIRIFSFPAGQNDKVIFQQALSPFEKNCSLQVISYLKMLLRRL